MSGVARRRKSGHRPNLIFKESAGVAGRGIPVNEVVLRFTSNLVGVMELDIQFLGYVFRVLGEAASDEVLRKLRVPKLRRAGSTKARKPRKTGDIVDLEDLTVDDADNDFEEWVELRQTLDRPSMDQASRTKLFLVKRPNLEGKVEAALRSAIRRERKNYVWRDGDLPGAPESLELSCLRQALCLSDIELDVLLFAFAYSRCKDFENHCDRMARYAGQMKTVAVCTGHSEGEVRKCLREDGVLVRSGLFSLIPQSMGGSFFTLDDNLQLWLSGDAEERLEDRFYRTEERPVLPLDSFEIEPGVLDVVQRLLAGEKPSSILVRGPAGTGKTEFVRSLAAALGKRACFAHTGAQGTADDRRVAAHMAAGMVPPAAGIVVVDEADSLLQTQVAFFGMFLPAEVDKGWVNDFLDHSKAHTVWITNETAGIPESTLRRFTYSIRFARFTRKQRERCFRLALEGAGLAGALSPDELAELSARYPVSAAGIAQAVDACRKVMGEDQTTSTHRDVRLLLEEFLVRHVEVTGVRKEEVHLPTSRYDLSALNTDCDPNALLASAREFVKTPAWGNAPDAPPFNLLFWGPPGTGKTEFARYLSSQLGLELHVRRASDLLDKYVGNSEKLIREAFLEAQQAHAILMIDEADSLLSRREGAIHSWEVSQVNELLSAMENHKGILVCSTNFLHNLDRAALRRFAWKVEFKPLAASCRRRLYDRHFTGIIGEGLPDHGASRLEAILGLTFGDYAAVLIRVRFLPRSQVTHDVLLAMLEKEAKYRDERTGNRVGFKS